MFNRGKNTTIIYKLIFSMQLIYHIFPISWVNDEVDGQIQKDFFKYSLKFLEISLIYPLIPSKHQFDYNFTFIIMLVLLLINISIIILLLGRLFLKLVEY